MTDRSDDAQTSADAPETPDRAGESDSARDVRDELVTTRHTLATPDGVLHYTARSGRVVLHEEKVDDGVWQGRKPRARVGITAYTLDDANPQQRPVTFAFNGGPGSASVWLHLGVLGPRRVVMGDVGELLPPPYGLADNADSLLSVSDLVFIDPVSTGHSRVVEGQKAADFHGFTPDIESVGELIRQWVTAEGRWLSPKLLAGESYGTTRAAALAQHLQSSGMYLNGLMLISAVLNFATNRFQPGNDNAYAMFLPFYAATAHYHGKHPGRELREVVAEAESYAARDYLYVLGRGSRLSAEEREAAVQTIARLTGVSEDYVDRANLRVEHLRYFTELRRDEGLTVGRLDSRFTGAAASAIAEQMDADPSMDAILGPYATAYQHYMRAELEVTEPAPFHVFGPDVIKQWSYKEFENAPVYVLDRLSRAMRQNPHLQVHAAFGYFDGATPFTSAEEDLAHLDIPQELQANVERKYYEAGHMMYVHEASRVAQCADLADFVRRATARG